MLRTLNDRSFDLHVRCSWYVVQRVPARTEPRKGAPWTKYIAYDSMLTTSLFFNLLQPPRYNIDNWEEMMMERDRRLTGHRRGQRVRVR